MVGLCNEMYIVHPLKEVLTFVEFLAELNKFTVDRLSVSTVDLRPFLGHYRCEA